MFDFIPINSYTDIYHHVLFGITLITYFQTIHYSNGGIKFVVFSKQLGLLVLICLLLYMGLRPINGVFVDMTTYSDIFKEYQLGKEVSSEGDIVFNYFVKFCSISVNVNTFFFICTSLYVIPLYVACKRFFKYNFFPAFLLFIGAFTFWAYGVNGIRTGIATSLIILGFSYIKENKLISFVLIALACGIHKSMLLPIVGFTLALFYSNTRYYYYWWFTSIILSIILGGFWESLFSSLGFSDERLGGYLTAQIQEGEFSHTGFRIDFLLYTMPSVILGGYYILRRHFNDKLYILLFNTYLVANSFWILVIRASFSNRFAQLSWFMMPIIIIYPLLKVKVWESNNEKIGYMLLLSYIFTYYMNVLK